MTDEQRTFLDEIAPLIVKTAPEYDIRVVSPVIAQAILESGWNRSKLSRNYHNYFGLKCGSKWRGKSVNLTTSEEYTPGTHTTIKDCFRVYESMLDGVRGYFEFIQLDRYKNLRGITDPEEYLQTIKADGYATSSTYVADLMKVIDTYDLRKYDKGAYRVKYNSVTAAIDAVISTATAEVGYLEKKSNSQLDSKTANAGSGNFTKYWRDIKPAWQGYSWCACFVTWCFMVVFGAELAAKLLTVYPFLYCPSLAAKKTSKTPKRGSIILFWRSGKNRYGHTGIVYNVDSKYVYTIEGNTSGGGSVVDNGQGVHMKKYSRASLDERTCYFMPDYALAVDKVEPVPDTSPITGTCTVTLNKMLPGAIHPQVAAIQVLLNALEYTGENGKPLSVDGKFGDNTAYALAAFQTAEKLGIKNTGTVGPKTWTALLNAIK